MAPLIHAQVTVQVRSGDPPADNVVHSLYFLYTDDVAAPPINWQSASDSILASFVQSTSAVSGVHFAMYQNRGITVRLYDMADAKPRPEKAISVHTPVSWEVAALAPREVACCMSYYAGRNLPRLRGRTFIGPFLASVMAERVDSGTANQLLALATDLKHQQGQYIDWQQYSPTTLTGTTVSDVWINDVWDTQSRREPAESHRYTLHL